EFRRVLFRSAKHDGGGAVFFGGQGNGPLDDGILERPPRYAKVQVKAGEHRGHLVGSLSFQQGLAAGHVLATLLENIHHVETGTATHAEQQHLHRSHPEVATTVVRGRKSVV